MRTNYIAASVIGVSLAMIGCGAANALAAWTEPGQPSAIQDGPPAWDQPPSEFREYQRKGFHDGVEGARQDFKHHRTPDPANRDEFHHPHVPGDMREDYRDGFRRGYEVAMQHLQAEQNGQ
jgi:hypothetical protein